MRIGSWSWFFSKGYFFQFFDTRVRTPWSVLVLSNSIWSTYWKAHKKYDSAKNTIWKFHVWHLLNNGNKDYLECLVRVNNGNLFTEKKKKIGEKDHLQV